jgi:hypothetical protein
MRFRQWLLCSLTLVPELNMLLDLEDSYDFLEDEYVLLDDEILKNLPHWVSKWFSV